MCGISGIYSLSNKPIKNLAKRLKIMTKMLHHRGPDQHGIFINKNKSFGFSNNRLSIVSAKEKILLPFTKNYKDYLSFNGEIYNYKEIKKKIFNTKFNTQTDTEVLYEYIQQKGIKNLKELNGMWSFAYYNHEKHLLTLSRDLVGERHLFYTFNNDEFIFCSEVKPIIEILKKKFNLNFNSILQSWKYNSCKPGETLINSIKRLAPGSNLELFNKKIKIYNHSFYEINKWINFFKKNPKESLVFKKFEEIIIKEIKLRVPEKNKFFVTLSGGIDSTILAFLLSKIKKFNAIFAVSKNEDKKIQKYSELDLSKKIAKFLKIRHHKIFLNNQGAIDDLKFFSQNSFDGCIDAGTSNFAGIARYVKSKKSKVVMLSDGLDETMGGYEVDIEANIIDKYAKNKKKFNFFLSNKKLKILNLKKNIDLEFKYSPFYSKVNHSICSNLFFKKIIKNFKFKNIMAYGNTDKKYLNFIKKMDFSQIRAFNYVSKSLPDMFNLRADKAFMKHSVETRCPYQAVNLIEFFLAMSNHYRFGKINNVNYGKYFLRRYLLKKVPKKISYLIFNQPKRGMGENLWQNKNIFKKLNFKKTIKETNFFKDFNFKKNAKEKILDPNSHLGNQWSAYNFIKMHSFLKKLR